MGMFGRQHVLGDIRLKNLHNEGMKWPYFSYALVAHFIHLRSSSPCMEIRKATAEAELSDMEAAVRGFDRVHFVYKMLLSNFLQFTLSTFYFLFSFLFFNTNSCTFIVIKCQMCLLSLSFLKKFIWKQRDGSAAALRSHWEPFRKSKACLLLRNHC